LVTSPTTHREERKEESEIHCITALAESWVKIVRRGRSYSYEEEEVEINVGGEKKGLDLAGLSKEKSRSIIPQRRGEEGSYL